MNSAARIAGLDEFSPPSLRAVERRRFQLWALSLVLFMAVVAALVLVLNWGRVLLPVWLTPHMVGFGIVGLALLFCLYALEKEVQLRRLTHLLVREKVLTAALTSRISELSKLLEAGKAINLDLHLDEVLTTILRCARELLQAHNASLMLTRGPHELHTVGTVGNSMATDARVRFGEGLAGQVAETRDPLLIDGLVGLQGKRPPEPGQALPRSAMCVPLEHRGELLGVLNVNAEPDHAYTEHDLRALTLFGEQAAAAIANARLYETQRLLASRQSHQALHDPLTGLPNRMLLHDRLEHALNEGREIHRRLALLFIDLDEFKRINDSLGHAAGDELLAAFSRRLRHAIRDGDSAARFGGDEFAVLVDDLTSVDQAVIAAERIQRMLEESFDLDGRRLRLRASIGVSMQRSEPVDADEMLRRADTALHVAKTRGGNQIVVFEEAMHAQAMWRLDLETELQRAFSQHEFEVYYQPIVRLKDRRIHGVEALVRWRHPDRGLIGAEDFVPVAEQLGILGSLDNWVLREACETLSYLPERDGATDRIDLNVNLSFDRLVDPALTEEIAEILRRTGFAPSRLVLEITESAMIEREEERTPEKLRALRALGVRLALDDFGTGYSSLAHLARFPIDVVKIDRTFIEGLEGERERNGLVSGIIRLGHGLDLEVVAEGVERDEQLRRLVQLGCETGQGYLLGMPMNGADLRRALQ
jgi:diguanylate cyclase (GGDEF)-like protein